MRPVRHLTPQYVLDRSRLAVWSRRHPETPWLTPTAVSFLEQWLRPSDRVLEWGSGRSTIWLSQRAAEVVSVEHHADWFAWVGERLPSGKSAGVRRHLVELGADVEEHEQAYVGVAGELSERSVDLVLVDGLYRDKCVAAALPRIHPGGLLVLDNADWFLPSLGSHSPSAKRLRDKANVEPAWESLADRLVDWRHVWTSSGVTDTAIWFAPS